jgi:N-methylhydantoinase A
MRYRGQGHEIVAPLPNRKLIADDAALFREIYDREYAALYGRVIPDADIEILTWAITVSTASELPQALGEVAPRAVPAAAGQRAVFDPQSDTFGEISLYRRADLAPGMRIVGPAIIAEDETSTFVSAQFSATLNAAGYIVMERL